METSKGIHPLRGPYGVRNRKTMKNQEEPMVTMEIPQGAVDTITDFIAKRSLDITTGLCLSVSLPDLGGPKSFAVFDLSEHRWVICAKVNQNDTETNNG